MRKRYKTYEHHLQTDNANYTIIISIKRVSNISVRYVHAPLIYISSPYDLSDKKLKEIEEGVKKYGSSNIEIHIIE